jgi:hypothetical protein
MAGAGSILKRLKAKGQKAKGNWLKAKGKGEKGKEIRTKNAKQNTK